jgi:hypothetical protein
LAHRSLVTERSTGAEAAASKEKPWDKPGATHTSFSASVSSRGTVSQKIITRDAQSWQSSREIIPDIHDIHMDNCATSVN